MVVHPHAVGVFDARGVVRVIAIKVRRPAERVDAVEPFIAAAEHSRSIAGELERARFYVRRVNSTPELVNAETLWLAARIEHKIGNRSGAAELGEQLRRRFPQSREAAAYDQGRFND